MKSSRSLPSTNRNYGGETPELRAARRRSQFIEAGKVLFGTVGYRKTTVRALCKQAELTDRYFYESFATTEDLLVAVYEQIIHGILADMLETIQKAGPSTDAEELIPIVLDAFFRQVEDPLASRVVWLEVLGISPRIDALYNGTLRRFADFLLNLIKNSRPEWKISEDVANVLTMGMIGAVSESAKDWLMTGYQTPRQVLVEGTSIIFQGLAKFVDSK